MPTTTRDDVCVLIDAELAPLVEIRHDLHKHPELMFEEQRTCEVVQRELSALGVEFRAGLARGTGVVAHLPATTPGARKAVALRADMDALPISETTGKSYASVHEGVMHACGHDGHTTMLLGAARVLSRLEHRPNPVTFVFQPAEEGGAGGEKMCEDGALLGDNGGGLGTPVGRIFGLHGWPQLPQGVVATRPGPLLAATDEFDITIRGVGGHAAYPHLTRDPIVCAAQVVSMLQTIASRSVGPLDSVVCTVGRIGAGSAHNIIPERAEIAGTVRTLLPDTRRLAKERLFNLVERTALAMGCEAEIDWQDGYPVTHNDPAMAEHALGVARQAFGHEHVELVETPSMGGEDFSYYGQHVPACFLLLGLLRPGQDPMNVPLLHQPGFDFNDEAIPTGVELLCRLALAEIGQG